MKRIAIVGAGPAGLFAAYELAGKAEVDLYDKGKDVEKRNCPSPNKCLKTCKVCDKLSGVSGAGGNSDGKFIFDTNVGSNLNEVIGMKENQNLVNHIEAILSDYDVTIRTLSSDEERMKNKYETRAAQCGAVFKYARQAHVGTDHLVELFKQIQDNLTERGVNIITKSLIDDVKDNRLLVNGIFSKRYDQILLCPGREGGREWIKKIFDNNEIEYRYNPIDIGVRVEVPRQVTDEITNFCRDIKVYMHTKTYRDLVRTFCTCPGGIVSTETHGTHFFKNIFNGVLSTVEKRHDIDEEFKGEIYRTLSCLEGTHQLSTVNGHANSYSDTDNTNFAFLVTQHLTEPMGNTNAYGSGIGELCTLIGAGRPLIQRLEDLRSGRRSKRQDLPKYLMQPSLTEDVTFGDITKVMPYRIMLDILEGLEQLDNIIEGVNSGKTCLAATEIKFHGIRAEQNSYLQTSNPDIYVAGDGAGLSRGIVGAGASGILAARGILRYG